MDFHEAGTQRAKAAKGTISADERATIRGARVWKSYSTTRGGIAGPLATKATRWGRPDASAPVMPPLALDSRSASFPLAWRFRGAAIWLTSV